MKTKKTFQGFNSRQVKSIIKFLEKLKQDGRVSMSKLPKGMWFRDWLKGIEILFGYSRDYRKYVTDEWVGSGKVIRLIRDEVGHEKVDKMLRSYRNQLDELLNS